MNSHNRMSELMHQVSDLMLTLGPRDTFRTMQQVLLEMMRTKDVPQLSWPYDDDERRDAGEAASANSAETAGQVAQHDLPEGARFIEGSVTNHAGTRHYKLFVPSGYRGQPLPLVVMLHGCKQDPDDFAVGTRMHAIAEERQCLVAYPAQTRNASRPKCWNWFYSVNQLRDHGEPSIIADITREVMRNYHVDERRVFIAGLSAGGAMASIMATTYPDLYSAAAIHSGLPYSAARDLYSALSAMKRGPRKRYPNLGALWNAADPLPAVPTIVFHGDADPVVHPSNGDHVFRQVTSTRVEQTEDKQADASVARTTEGQVPGGRSYTRTVHQDLLGNNIAEQWLVHGGGHAWSGGCRDGSFTDPEGPDATSEMMRFFLEQAPQQEGLEFRLLGDGAHLHRLH